MYTDLSTPMYPIDDTKFVCNSDSLDTVTTTRNAQILTIYYESITKDNGQPRDPLAEVVINCKYWRNPYSPVLVKGFMLTTFDNTDPNGKIVDQSDPDSDGIKLDASSYTAYPMILTGKNAFTVPSNAN